MKNRSVHNSLICSPRKILFHYDNVESVFQKLISNEMSGKEPLIISNTYLGLPRLQ